MQMFHRNIRSRSTSVMFSPRNSFALISAIAVGMTSSLAWVLLSADTFTKVYGLSVKQAAEQAYVPFSQPGIVTIPLGFLTLVVVSLLTRKRSEQV